MTFVEIALVVFLALLIGGAWSVAVRHKDPTVFWNPLTLFAAIFAYYFVVGPLLSLALRNTSAYGFDLRDMMWKAWLAGALGLASIFAGFAIRIRPLATPLVPGMTPWLRRRLWICCGVLFGLGLAGFLYNGYISGQSLADVILPFHQGIREDSMVEREGVAAGNYLFLLINSFIPALSLLAALTADRSWPRRVCTVLPPLAIVTLFYISLGFRHRIAILFLAVTATSYLMRARRPRVTTVIASLGAILLLFGLIVLTRTYGRGLDVAQLANLSVTDLLLGGFNDTGTFFTTAIVIESFPSTFPHVGLDPVWVALTIPVPRLLWPGKPYPAFLQYFEYLMGTQGQAVPVTGEHYMMGGWVGIVVGGVMIGALFRMFWEVYRANPRNPFVVAAYGVAWALGFPVINRGYLAQTMMEFFFDLVPLALMFLSARKAMLLPARRRSGRAPAVPAMPALAVRPGNPVS